MGFHLAVVPVQVPVEADGEGHAQDIQVILCFCSPFWFAFFLCSAPPWLQSTFLVRCWLLPCSELFARHWSMWWSVRLQCIAHLLSFLTASWNYPHPSNRTWSSSCQQPPPHRSRDTFDFCAPLAVFCSVSLIRSHWLYCSSSQKCNLAPRCFCLEFRAACLPGQLYPFLPSRLTALWDVPLPPYYFLHMVIYFYLPCLCPS